MERHAIIKDNLAKICESETDELVGKSKNRGVLFFWGGGGPPSSHVGQVTFVDWDRMDVES